MIWSDNMIEIGLGIVVGISFILLISTIYNNKFHFATIKIEKAQEDIDMYLQKKKEKTVQPVIYYMRDLFKLSFDPSIYRKIDRTKSEEVMDFEGYRLDFEQGLRSCLDEIFDKETPFVQTNNPKVCSYCPFKDICGK